MEQWEIVEEVAVTSFLSIEPYSSWALYFYTHLINLPTPYTLGVSDPGLYQCSKYCNEPYRPKPNSMMRSLSRSFDTLNKEALMLSIYDFASSVDSFSQPTSSVTVSASHSTAFAVTTLRPKSHELQKNSMWTIRKSSQAPRSIALIERRQTRWFGPFQYRTNDNFYVALSVHTAT